MDESEEDVGKTEELETSTLQQARFIWAHTWMEEGVPPVLADSKAQRLLAQVFGPLDPFLIYSVLVLHFSVLTPDHM